MTDYKFHFPEIERMAARSVVRANAKKARRMALAFLKKHRIPRPHCPCGAPGAHMHHVDYSKPYEVAFLCERHHMVEHQARMGMYGGFTVRDLTKMIPRRRLGIVAALKTFKKKGVRRIRSAYAESPNAETIERLANENHVTRQTIRNVLKGLS